MPLEVRIVVIGGVLAFIVGTVLVRGWIGLAAWAFLALYVAYVAARVWFPFGRRR